MADKLTPDGLHYLSSLGEYTTAAGGSGGEQDQMAELAAGDLAALLIELADEPAMLEAARVLDEHERVGYLLQATSRLAVGGLHYPGAWSR